jgi:hypothetical protein
MYEWLEQEIAEVKTPGFHVVDEVPSEGDSFRNESLQKLLEV